VELDRKNRAELIIQLSLSQGAREEARTRLKSAHREVELLEKDVAAMEHVLSRTMPDPKTRAEEIRQALRALDRQASPKEVTDVMRADDFDFGDVDAAALVANELNRMSQSKSLNVVKSGRGLYAYVEPPPETGDDIPF